MGKGVTVYAGARNTLNRRVLPSGAYKAGGKTTDKEPGIPAKYQIIPTNSIILPKKLTAGF